MPCISIPHLLNVRTSTFYEHITISIQLLLFNSVLQIGTFIADWTIYCRLHHFINNPNIHIYTKLLSCSSYKHHLELERERGEREMMGEREDCVVYGEYVGAAYGHWQFWSIFHWVLSILA